MCSAWRFCLSVYFDLLPLGMRFPSSVLFRCIVPTLRVDGRDDGSRVRQRTGSAVGGHAPEPWARAGSPCAYRVHPLRPDTRNVFGWCVVLFFWFCVAFSTWALGSICHHLQDMQTPQCVGLFMGTPRISRKILRAIPSGG